MIDLADLSDEDLPTPQVLIIDPQANTLTGRGARNWPWWWGSRPPAWLSRAVFGGKTARKTAMGAAEG
jgi:hypothetical protein